MTPPTLWLLPVALGDITHEQCLPANAVAVGRSLSHFVVENAKTARRELKRIEHPLPMREIGIVEIPEAPDQATCDQLLSPLAAGQDLGLMSEAGCPAIADPGALLVKRAHERGIRVRPLVGPSSLLLALMASGLDGQRFAFHGYLPARDPERSQRIQMLEKRSSTERQTQICIETPYRNAALLSALIQTCRPATRLCVAADLTLESEWILTQPISQWRKIPLPDLEKRPSVFLFLAN